VTHPRQGVLGPCLSLLIVGSPGWRLRNRSKSTADRVKAFALVVWLVRVVGSSLCFECQLVIAVYQQ